MLITLSKFSIFWGFQTFKVQIARRSYPQTVDNLKTNTPRGTIQKHIKMLPNKRNGFGMKSIRYVVQKYKGEMLVYKKERRFVLEILFAT